MKFVQKSPFLTCKFVKITAMKNPAIRSGVLYEALCEKFLFVSDDEDDQDDQRQDVGYIESRPPGEFQSLPAVRFSDEVIPTPAPFAGTEQQVDQRTQRQQIVGDQEVLQILNVADMRERDAAPHIEAQNAGHGQKQ